MTYTVGCVPYVNAIPLVSWFEELGDQSHVKVVYDLPSRLPAFLESGEADAILVSSVDALRIPGRKMAEGVCIGSHGPVKSVRLFSKVPPSQIRSLALDQSSMTSNRLAQIILKELYRATPTTHHHAPNQAEMLREHDACVLIGDIGMMAPSKGLHVLDLGEEWRKVTGKPFVWAAWIGNEQLTPELALFLYTSANMYSVGRNLRDSKISRLLFPRWYREIDEATHDITEARHHRILEIGRSKSGWTEEVLRDYFLNVMVYEMDDFVLSGLTELQRLLLKHGFDDCNHFPEIIAAGLPDGIPARD